MSRDVTKRKHALDALFKKEEPLIKQLAQAVLDRLEAHNLSPEEAYLVAEGLRRAAETLEGRV